MIEENKALKSQIAQQKGESSNTAIEALMDFLTINTEVLRNGDFVVTDSSEFQRRILLEGMIDKLDWMIHSQKGMTAYVDQTRQRVTNAQRRYTGDEISTTYLKGAIAEAKTASLKLDTFTRLMQDAQNAYIELTGDDYTPYGRIKRSNVRSDEKSEIPADIAAELEALGMSPDLGTTANTNGVDSPEDIA
jgi:hypothetical protein